MVPDEKGGEPKEADKSLSMIFEKSWESGEVPGDWKEGKMVSIFKNDIKEDPRSY